MGSPLAAGQVGHDLLRTWSSGIVKSSVRFAFYAIAGSKEDIDVRRSSAYSMSLRLGYLLDPNEVRTLSGSVLRSVLLRQSGSRRLRVLGLFGSESRVITHALWSRQPDRCILLRLTKNVSSYLGITLRLT